MKKRVYKVSSLLFVCLVFTFSYFCIQAFKSKSVHSSENINFDDDGKLTLLCVGFDEAGSNTDSLILTSLDIEKKELSVLQIPRDTYYSRGTSNGKLNQLYSCSYNKTKDRFASMEALKNEIQDTFSLKIDYFIAVSLDVLSSAVDKMGGIEIDLPYDLKYSDPEQNLYIDLRKGNQVLDGERSLYFVRYRAGYLDGDIGRVDAQKIFLSAFLNKLRSDIKLTTVISILRECISDSISDIPVKTFLSLAPSVAKDAEKYQIYYMTLPGEPTRKNIDNGLSYYVVNRVGAIDMLGKYFDCGFDKENFDINGVLVDSERVNFTNIYYAPNIQYNVYTDDEIKTMKINLKSKQSEK